MQLECIEFYLISIAKNMFQYITSFICRLRFYVIMTSQRELFPRLTADMRRFKKLPQIHRDPSEVGGLLSADQAEACGSLGGEQDPWEEMSSKVTETSLHSDGNEFFLLVGDAAEAQGVLYTSPVFPLLNNEVALARRKTQTSVEQAMGHCRRDNLWRRLFHGEHLALDKLKLTKLSFSELEELMQAVQSRLVGEIDPQLVRFLPKPFTPNKPLLVSGPERLQYKSNSVN